MATFWVQASTGQWACALLAGDAFGLRGDPLRPAPIVSGAGSPPSIHRCQVQGRECWVLLTSPTDALWVNGQPTLASIHVLRDRDSLWWPGSGIAYFSAEALARVEPFSAVGQLAHCVRCKLEMKPGQPAVRCPNPGCGLYHHEDPEQDRNCWTYAPTCAACDQPTALDAGYRWVPPEA